MIERKMGIGDRDGNESEWERVGLGIEMVERMSG